MLHLASQHSVWLSMQEIRFGTSDLLRGARGELEAAFRPDSLIYITCFGDRPPAAKIDDYGRIGIILGTFYHLK